MRIIEIGYAQSVVDGKKFPEFHQIIIYTHGDGTVKIAGLGVSSWA